MKNILHIAVLLLLQQCSFAQTGALQIINTTDCTVGAIMFAESSTIGGSCGAIYSSSVNITAYPNPGSTQTWSNPADFQSSIGFNVSVTTGAPPGYLTDFTWDYIGLDMVCPCGLEFSGSIVGNTSGSCSLTNLIGPGSCEGDYISASYSTGSLGNLVIYIY